MKVKSMVQSLFLPTCTLTAFPGHALALPTVTVSDGVLVGTTTTLPSATASVNKFLGVPFAAIPTGSLRWAPPAAVPTYTTRQANAWSNSCVQQFIDSPYPPNRTQTMQLFNNPAPVESEDCLYLNVYVPSSGATGKAVMFWIHGGGLVYGTASYPWYDGSSFAAHQDVIVVAANYRTNVFGFPHSGDITDKTKWNIGFLDQRQALQWVQKNIAAFGGDPTKVTIFGESSGATSVDRLVTTMGSNTPFRAAIMQSGTSSVTAGGADTSTTYWDSLVQLSGCEGASPVITCMRGVAATAIKSTIEKDYNATTPSTPFFAFNPIPDGVTELASPEASRLAGSIAKVPVLQGTNAQEGRLFSAPYAVSAPGANVNAIDAAYPVPGAFPDDDTATAQAWTESVYQCPAAVVTSDDAKAGIPAWRYYFNASFANYGSVPGFTNRGVYHTTEIPIVFGTYPSSGATAQEISLSSYMQTAWATFAKNPTSGPDPAWPKVGTASGSAYIGVLGNSGNTFTNLTVIQSTTLDGRCSLFYPIYGNSTTGNTW
ncbi:alpha/beta-hydrolase [Mytilinidion resinicola]|uniref:Carboxylic ester hydrolase n=1 Tax=Mytilinidion resinicola TaxID=574789 RepID=A0A6A6YKG1_9PEZI|nr:alpha/beta-hydrolase [Mytilinidion resinicola]KAF2809356.1 alpha/beta-hydrolase [Mytilinidion resinicola]